MRRFQALLTKVDDKSASLSEVIELENVSDHISLLLRPKEPPPPPNRPRVPFGQQQQRH